MLDRGYISASLKWVLVPAVFAIASSKGWAADAQFPMHAIVVQPLALEIASHFGGSSGMIENAGQTALTLEDLQAFAMMANPSIDRAAALVHAAQGRAQQVGLRPNPEVGVDLQQLGSDGLAEQYGVLLGQEFVWREKLKLNRSVAGHEVNRLMQELAAQRQRVRTDVAIRYIKALRAQRQIELARQLVEIGEKGATVTKELFEASEVSRADILQAELEVESAYMILQVAENRQVAAWRELAAITGQASLEPQPLSGVIAEHRLDISFDETLSLLRSQSPEIAALVAAIERCRCNLRRQQIEPRPNVTVQGLVNWRDNGIGGGADGGLVVSLPLPIWNKNQGGIREARYQLVAAERALEQLERALLNRLAPVHERYRNASEQVQRFQNRILPKSAETLKLTRQTYELGEISFVNLLTVQRTYARNQVSYLDSLEALRVAEAEINGLLLSGSLTSR